MKKFVALILAVALVLGVSAVALAGENTFKDDGSGNMMTQDGASLKDGTLDIGMYYYAQDTRCITVSWDEDYPFHYQWSPELRKWEMVDAGVYDNGGKAFDIEVTNKGFNGINVDMKAELNGPSPYINSLDLTNDGKKAALSSGDSTTWTLNVGINLLLDPDAFVTTTVGDFNSSDKSNWVTNNIGITVTIDDIQ